VTVREFISGHRGRTPTDKTISLGIFDRAVEALEALWDCSCPDLDEGETCERCLTLAALR
jgi:hypothetical protein